jgi:uncharacterized protein (DUF2336 family)
VSNVLGYSKELHSLAGSLRQSADGLSDIFVAISSLFQLQSGQFSPAERALAADILKRISKDVEMSLRIALAEKVADRADTPAELINLLADDRIEVARPVLMRSPVLSDADLLRVITQAGADHHLAIAQRPELGDAVTSALARSESEAVLIALLRNEGAKISNDTFQTLAGRAKAIEPLQEPLAGRKDLPPRLAAAMYTWVSGALKQALTVRYPQIASSLAADIESVSESLKADQSYGTPESAKKLVDKLNAAGQLKASFLIRVLQQGQMELFEQGFAALLKLDVETTRTLLYDYGSNTTALACRAAGIDRSVFPTVYRLSRRHRGIGSAISESELRAADTIFQTLPKAEAFDRLRVLAR